MLSFRPPLPAGTYNPNRPRVPAGNPDGGFDLLGPRYDTGRREEGEHVRVAGEGDDPRRYSVALDEEEEAKGIGHTINRHVDQTDAALMGRMRLDYYRFDTASLTIIHYGEAYGSFRDKGQANDFTNQVLQSNKAMVDEAASGKEPKAVLEKCFGYPTGREAYRPGEESEPYMRTTYAVRVVIEHDKRSWRGYRVRTALPVNDW